MVTLIAPRKIVATATASATLARGAHTPVDATSGALTMTLPANAPAGVENSVEKVDASTNVVTVSGTLRGVSSSITLTSQYEARTFLSDGAGSWTPISDHRTAASLRVDAKTKSITTRGAAFGTSLTRGNQDTTGVLWPAELEKTAGMSIFNKGISGCTTTDSALWAGAYDPTFTVSGGSIPATTVSTALTAVNVWDGHRTGGGGPYAFNGTIAGVPGTLIHDATTNAWTFSRTTAGSAVAATGTQAFHCTESDLIRDRIWFLGDFTNLLYTNDPQTGVPFTTQRIQDIFSRDVDAMIARMTPTTKRYLVFTMGFNDTGQYGANANYQKILTCSAALTTRYGDQAFDIRAWLVANGLASQQMTPTTQDNTDMGRDVIPTSLHTSGDPLHLNAAGYRAWAAGVKEAMALRGWTPLSTLVPATATKVPADPILTTGSLLLVEPGHPEAPWAEGLPLDGQRMPNLADSQARAAIGGLSDAGSTNPIMRRASTGVRAARTVKGGITYARPSSTGVFALTPAQSIMQRLIDTPANNKFFSAWVGLSQSPSAAGVDGQFFRLGAFSGGATNYYAAPSGNSTGISAGGTAYMVIGTTGTLSNTDVGPRCIQVGDTIRGSAADQTATAAQLQSFLFGFVASAASGTTPTVSVGSPGNATAFLTFYRFYMEDLTVSGRSIAAVKAIDDALYAQAFGSTGRYYGDNFAGDKALSF